MLASIASWFQRRTVLIWSAYFVILEILSWPLADAPGCLIHPDHNDGAGYNDNQHGCATFLVGLVILLGRGERFLEHHDKSIVAAFTVVLALSTILLWRATHHLYEAGERQLTHFEGTAERQARETVASIAAARDSARAAENTALAASDQVKALFHINRAFVSIREVTLDAEKNEDDTVRTFLLSVIWQNSGDTPTHHMLTYVNGRRFDKAGIPDDFDYPDIETPKRRTPSVLGPQAAIAVGRAPLPLDIAKEIWHRDSRLFMWGWCDYNDIFPGTLRHRTEFCFEILLSGKFPENLTLTWAWHTQHNGADDECMRKPAPYVRPTSA